MLNLNHLRLLRLLFSLAILSLGAMTARAQQPESPPTNPAPPAPPTAPPPPPDSGDEEPPSAGFHIGPEVGVFFPSSSRTRYAFGNHFVNLGVGLGAITKKSARGALSFDLSFVTNHNKESNLFVVPIGIGYTRRLGSGASVAPYAGASVDALLVNMKTTKGDYDVKSGFRSGYGGSVFLGTTLGGSAYVQARYLAATKVSGFDLSGLSLSTGIRF